MENKTQNARNASNKSSNSTNKASNASNKASNKTILPGTATPRAATPRTAALTKPATRRTARTARTARATPSVNNPGGPMQRLRRVFQTRFMRLGNTAAAPFCFHSACSAKPGASAFQITSNSSSMRAPRFCRYSQPNRDSSAVDARYSCGVACFATVAFAGIFAAAHHGPFGLVQQRRNDLQRRILPFGRHKFHRRRMQAVRHKARAFHKARAHQHLKHAVPHERQRYGRLLMDVYLRLCFK